MKIVITFRFWPLGKSILLNNSKFSTPGHTSVVIEPHNCEINMSCCCSVFPCIIGDLQN